MADDILVVDFGTCFSSVAVVSSAGVQLVREPTSGSFSWPSAVYADEGRLFVGSLALSRRNRDPARYRSELKRYLGQDDIVLGGVRYPPRELVTAVLRVLREEAEKTAGTAIRHGVLTVPASYERADHRRGLMIAAAEDAGLDKTELLPEPVAAAFASVAGPGPGPGELVLVYDFGGGTFDAALVRTSIPDHQVLGSAALDDCGGLDLDALLVARLTADASSWMTRALSELASRPGESSALRLRATFGDVARNLKHQLSDTSEAEEYVLPDSPSARMTRPELTGLAGPVLDRTVGCCQALLKRASVTAAEVSAIITVGGSTRMPAVADELTRAFSRPLRPAEDPDLAVVLGAARWAASHAIRQAPALPPAGGRTFLKWAIPPARLLRWLIPPGVPYPDGTPLVVVRFEDGTLGSVRQPARPDRAGVRGAGRRGRRRTVAGCRAGTVSVAALRLVRCQSRATRYLYVH